MKRIMVDMSATLIHHGHIRILKKASEYGNVIAGLTTDDEITKHKGYKPEISYAHRKEVLESIKYVSEVVATPWLIDEEILDKYKIDLLNKNKKTIKKVENIEQIEKNLIKQDYIRKTFTNKKHHKKFNNKNRFRKKYNFRSKNKKYNFENKKLAT